MSVFSYRLLSLVSYLNKYLPDIISTLTFDLAVTSIVKISLPKTLLAFGRYAWLLAKAMQLC